MMYVYIVLLLSSAMIYGAEEYPLARIVVPIANVVKEPGVTLRCTAPVLGRDVMQLSGQVIYNELVRVMNKRHGWYYVQVPHLTYLLDGVSYCVEGWLRKDQVIEMLPQDSLAALTIVCIAPWTAIYQRSADGLSYTHLFAVPCGTKLEGVRNEGFWDRIRLCDGREAYVPASAIRSYTQAGPCSDVLRKEMIRCARMHIGAPYCFVGCSAYDPRTHHELTGFDCSGLVFRLHDMFGIAVPRNSASQYTVARMVSPADMRAGDLVFLARCKENSDVPAVYHVMIYSGEGTLIEATARRSDDTIDPQPLREIPVVLRLGKELSALPQGARYREDSIYCASLLPA